jgi:hypothetical protein
VADVDARRLENGVALIIASNSSKLSEVDTSAEVESRGTNPGPKYLIENDPLVTFDQERHGRK